MKKPAEVLFRQAFRLPVSTGVITIRQG